MTASAANSVAQRTGTVRSGDVTLFYRRFGTPGGAPVLIHHGAQYYDSADWIEVGSALARDREVVAYDARGYANSTWSPSKNYSVDAAIGDSIAVIDHLGWRKTVFMGHSRGGAFAILLAARFPERAAGLVIVDRPLHSPIGHAPHDGRPAVGNVQPVFATIEEAMAAMSRDKDVASGTSGRARLDAFLKPVAGGYAITGRDPDYNNTIPVGVEGWRSQYDVASLWDDLAKVNVPVILIRGIHSDRYPPEALARLARDFPHIEVVPVASGHDVAAGAPQALIAAVSRFLVERIDRAC